MVDSRYLVVQLLHALGYTINHAIYRKYDLQFQGSSCCQSFRGPRNTSRSAAITRQKKTGQFCDALEGPCQEESNKGRGRHKETAHRQQELWDRRQTHSKTEMTLGRECVERSIATRKK